MQWGDAVSASAFIPGAPHKDARAVVDTNKAVGTSATFDRVVEVKALLGDLLAIVGEVMRAIVISSFDPCPLVISNATMGSCPNWKIRTYQYTLAPMSTSS
jgi:hypothetical protein